MSIPLAGTENRLERLRMLTEVSRALTYTTSIEEVLNLAVARTAQLMGADQALIMLTNAEGLLAVRAAHGVDEERMSAFREPLNESLVARLQGLLGYPSIDCFLSVPLVAQGEVTGLMAAVRLSGEPVTGDDEWLLSALADQTAVALENARLTRRILQGEEERGRAVEAQGRAHATLSHELRAPLTAIHAYSALLLDGVLDPLTDRQREAIGRIRMSGEHLLAVIEDVLDMGRISAGAITLKIRDIPAAQVLDEAWQMLRPAASEKKHTLHSSPASDLVVRADPDRLRQALVNLIDNAIKYTPRGGTIEVSVSDGEWEGTRCAAIAVTDNGRGISASDLTTLFEPYERGGTAPQEVGLGLGLYISRRLVRQMHGEILVESQSSVGSTFTLLIPLARESPDHRGGMNPIS
jgi:phosphoserine phosphatase RsbU/P